MATSTDGGTTASLSNTPQAKDDYFVALEDRIYCFDVMANDLGGAAKTLWSIDNTSDDGALDLIAKDVAGVAEYSEMGAKIALTADGKILYDTHTSSAIASLAEGETAVDQFTYAIRLSNGTLSWATVNVTVTGTNDGPDIGVGSGDSASANRNETNAGLTAAGTLTVTDIDTSDVVDISVTSVSVGGTGGAGGIGNTTLLAMLSLSGNVDNAADGTLGSLGWHFDSGSQAFNYLQAGETLILTYTLTADDGHGGTDTQTVTVTITGTNDAAVITEAAGADHALVEAGGVNNGTPGDASAGGTLSVSDVDAGESSFQAAAPADLVGTYGTFTFNAATGAWTYTLDNTLAATQALNAGDPASDTLTVYSADGTSYDIVVNITGTNDAPALTGTQATLAAGTEDNAYTVSKADLLAGFTDVEGNVLGVSNLTADHGTVVLNLDGSYTITPTVNYNGIVTLSYTVVDGHGGSVSATLSFNLAAVNDPAVIGGTTSGAVTEDAVPNTVSGSLTASDVDNPPNTFIAVSSPTASNNGYGTFTMTAAGVWTYALDNSNALVNALVAGAFLMDSFTVQAADGTTQLISVTINGANDVIVVTPPTPFVGPDPNDFDSLSGGFTVSGNFSATNGADTFTGDSGGQTLNGQGGNDAIYGAGGNDNINGNNENDTLYGQVGDDTVDGNNGLDTLYGGSGNDTLTGGNDGDTLYGGSGNDIINGSGGDDIIIGGYGADTLTGGLGNDTFKFLDVKDTNDTILDFMAGDQIDLSGIDANPSTLLNDAFAWGGTTPTAHGAWYAEGGGNTVLYADTDGNPATAEFMLTLQTFSSWGTSYDTPAEGPPPGVIL